MEPAKIAAVHVCGGDATGPRRAFLPLDLIFQEKLGAEPFWLACIGHLCCVGKDGHCPAMALLPPGFNSLMFLSNLKPGTDHACLPLSYSLASAVRQG